MIEKYIRQLLFEHDCVVIPDFGGFIAKYASATVHPVRHTFLPPSKEVAFNEMLRINDGLLISHVAVGEQMSREQATKLIKDFVDYVRGQIWQNQKYNFEEIGILFLNPEQKMEFEPANRINYLNAGFGLPEMSFSQIERSSYQHKVRTKDRMPVPHTAPDTTEEGITKTVFRRNRQLWYALGFTGLVILSAFTGYLLFDNPNNQALSSLNPFAVLMDMPSEEDSTVKPMEEALAARRQQVMAETMPVETLTRPNTENEWDMVAEVPTPETPDVVTETKAEEKTEVAKPETKPAPRVAETSTVKTTKTTASAASVVKKTVKAIRYYVIVNGFSVVENATRFRRELTQNGHKGAKVLERGSNGLIKVSVGDFADRSEAEAKINEIKNTYPGAWVFEN